MTSLFLISGEIFSEVVAAYAATSSKVGIG